MDLSGKTFPSFCWTTAYILFICYNTIILFGEVLELYYLETLKTTMLKIFSYHKQYRYSLRTVGELPKEHTIPNPHPIPHFTYMLSFIFSILEMFILLLSGMFSVRSMFVWYWWLTPLLTIFQLYRENHRPVTSHWHTLSQNVAASIPRHDRLLYTFDNTICLNQPELNLNRRVMQWNVSFSVHLEIGISSFW